MKRISQLLRRIVPAVLLLGVALTTASPVSSQVAETEPNNTCAAAQAIGAVTLPFTLNGSLDTPPSTPDVDFFRFTSTPGTVVQVDLEGQATGKGTLSDPLVAVFDSFCSFPVVDDNSGTAPNARLQLAVPADGVLVVAASSCCDYGFTGGGLSSGSYQLTLTTVPSAASISGRVVDAKTGAPLSGVMPPFAFVELRRCANGECLVTVATQTADDQGQFRFENGLGLALPAGTYQLLASAGLLYQPAATPPFDVGEGQNYDAGDIALTPVPTAGSISGRVVDATSGAPLRGDGPPFAFARLLQCDPFFGCFEVDSQPLDGQGRFRFVSDFLGAPLPAGTYQVLLMADQYRERTIGPFTVGDGQDLDLGDITLASFPVRFSEIRPCGNLPPEGGPCQYSIRVTNGLSSTLSGLVWTIVETIGTGVVSETTRFQPGLPTWYILDPGASRVVRFEFEVPSTVPNGTTICAQATASQGSNFFDVAGRKNLFCIVKGFTGFNVMSEKDAHALAQQSSRARARNTPAGRR